MIDLLVSTLISVLSGALVLLVALRILQIPASLGRLLMLSFAPTLMVLPASLIIGIVLANHLGIGVVVVACLEAFCAALLIQLQAKSQNKDLPALKAYAVGAVFAGVSMFGASWISDQVLRRFGGA